jgi:hypothetical protein
MPTSRPGFVISNSMFCAAPDAHAALRTKLENEHAYDDFSPDDVVHCLFLPAESTSFFRGTIGIG